MSDVTEQRFQTLHEIVQQAQINLNRNIWDYLIGATETETTMRRNRQALDRSPSARACCATSRSRLLGQPFRQEAPPAGLRRAGRLARILRARRRRDGRRGGRRVRRRPVPQLRDPAGAGGDGGQGADALKIFQLYVRGDGEWIDDYVRRAVSAGYDAFCITVDTAHYSRRERDITKRFVKTWRTYNTGMNYQAALQLARHRALQVEARDPAHPQGHRHRRRCPDGRRARRRGDLRLQSRRTAARPRPRRHGGAARDRRRGRRQGAHHHRRRLQPRQRHHQGHRARRRSRSAIGRLYCYGLAAAGSAGVVRVLELLEEEIRTCFGLLGVTGFAALDKSYLHPGRARGAPLVHSAFPLIGEGY